MSSVAATTDLPHRQVSTSSAPSEEGATFANPTDTASLLAERLQAWKHAVGNLEDYIVATEKVQKAQGKEYEKVLKTIQSPLKQGNHFDQNVGGIASLFENMRINTQGVVNSHLETEQNLKGSVLPILERLHKEIKNKTKELSSGASKGAKDVEKARNDTQKHIELLGQATIAATSSQSKMSSGNDPYIVNRGVIHRLHKQVLQENNNKHDTISVQANFAAFEHHIVEVLQQTLMSFNQFMSAQAQKEQSIWADITNTAQTIDPNFEWASFNDRYAGILVDPNAPDRSVSAITFPNQDHASTKPLIEGTLERKSRNKLSFSGYSTGYYAVTASKFLHEFKDNDDMHKDPTPELSIFLPDATIGSPSGEKFNIKGKDLSGGIGSKLSGSSEMAFKAHSAADAAKWYEIIRAAAGNGPVMALSEPSSPIAPEHTETVSSLDGKMDLQPLSTQTVGTVTGGETVASPVAAHPSAFTEKV